MPIFYIAKVIDNDDPDQEGKVKIKIDPFHDGFKPSELPMAKPITQGTGGSSTYGSSNIPETDSNVWVFFEDEQNYRHPFYFGDLSIKNSNPHTLFDENVKSKITGFTSSYPNVKFQYYKNGICVGVSSDSSNKEIFVYHPTGNGFFYIKNDGTYDIKDGKGNKIKTSSSGIQVTDVTTNDVTMNSSGVDITAVAGQVNCNCGSSSVVVTNASVAATATSITATAGGFSVGITAAGLAVAGNTITADSSGMTINGNFKVGT